MKLFGRNPIMERLRTAPSTINKLHVQLGLQGISAIKKKANQRGIPIVSVPKSKIQKIGRNMNTQGVVADVIDYLYVDYGQLIREAITNNDVLIFLDNVQDPQNLGAIIRSLACLGGFGIVLPKHESVKVTESVLRVASGGDNYVPIARVANLGKAIRAAKDAGIYILGTVITGGTPLDKVDLPFPVGVVIGSEEKGIRDVTQKEIDVAVSIPMGVQTMSFNAAHATTVLCYEITRQRKNSKYKKI